MSVSQNTARAVGKVVRAVSVIVFLFAGFLIPAMETSGQSRAVSRTSSFVYKSAGNPDVEVLFVAPPKINSKTRVIVIMTGINRNADEYLATWASWAERNNYIAVSPIFDEAHWDGSRGYNYGNVFTGENGTGQLNARSKWAFAVVDGIAADLRRRYGLKQAEYDIFGHSAGAQFVHRLLLFYPEARIRYAIAANAGWYTLPDLTIPFPYGLRNPLLSFTTKDLSNWTRRKLILMLGTDDLSRDGVFRKTAEADAQGQTRYARGKFMFGRVKAIDPQTSWSIADVPGVGHDQEKMGFAAQKQLEALNKR